MYNLFHLLIVSRKTEKGPKALFEPIVRESLPVLPVLPILPAAGFCPKLPHLFLLPYSRFRRFPLLLLLPVVIHINDKADENHGQDCHRPRIYAAVNNIPDAKRHCHAK